MTDKKNPAPVPEDDPDDRFTWKEGDLVFLDADGNPVPLDKWKPPAGVKTFAEIEAERTAQKPAPPIHIYLPEDGGDEEMK